MRSYENNVLGKSEYFIHSPSKIARENMFYPIHVGHFFYNDAYSLRRNAFDSFLIFYVLEGGLILDDQGVEKPVEKDHFLFLDCYRSHAHFTRGTCEAIWLHFDGQNARQLYELITERVGEVFTMYDPLPITGKIAQIFEIFKRKSPIREAQFSRLIYDLLMDLYLFAAAHGQYQGRSSVIEEVTAYINEHFKEDPPLETLAKIAVLSPYHFIRVFKKETGMTPHEYIINLKIRTVKYLLKNTTLPIKDICYEAGFSGESVLCSAFRRHAGMSPTEYRKNVEITV